MHFLFLVFGKAIDFHFFSQQNQLQDDAKERYQLNHVGNMKTKFWSREGQL